MDRFKAEQLAEYRRVFDIFDKSKDGTINGPELFPLMEYLGLPTTFRQFQAFLTTVDSNKDGKISFDEFIAIMSKTIKTESLAKVFRAADKNKDGYLSLDELRNALQQNGESVSNDVVERYMAVGDISGDGRLNYDEFSILMVHYIKK